MKASVIVSLFNNFEDIHDLLPSLENQELNGHEMEVIIRDDGSYDNACVWIEKHFPWVRLIRGENVGFSRSNNIAAQHASGDILVFVNADTILDRRFVSAGLAVLEVEPKAGGVNCSMIMPWVMRKEEFIGGIRPVSGYGYFLSPYGFAVYKKMQLRRSDTAFLSGGGCFVRREAIGDADPFSEDLWGGTAYCEDLDLSLRLIAKGWRLCFEPTAVLYHNQRPIKASGLKEIQKFLKVSTNRITVYASNLFLPAFLRSLPHLLGGLSAKIASLNMPQNLKKKAIPAATALSPLFLFFTPYWVYINLVQKCVRPQIGNTFFMNGTLP